jgi:6-phosphogluconolactonase
MTAPNVEILADKAALVQRALSLVCDRIHQSIVDHGYCTLALAGGSTPKPLYEALAQQDLPWSKLYIFWGDERYVGVDHPDSNAGMAKRAWLDQVAIPPEQIFIAPTGESDPAASAQQYETNLKDVFTQLQALSAGGVPVFDLVLLGTGDDGHTASLFPHTPALSIHDRWVTVGVKQNEPRITFTVPLINHSRMVVFLAAGANKQNALSHIFAEVDDDRAYPARLIRPQGELWWLLDQPAGAFLSATVNEAVE